MEVVPKDAEKASSAKHIIEGEEQAPHHSASDAPFQHPILGVLVSFTTCLLLCKRAYLRVNARMKLSTLCIDSLLRTKHVRFKLRVA